MRVLTLRWYPQKAGSQSQSTVTDCPVPGINLTTCYRIRNFPLYHEDGCVRILCRASKGLALKKLETTMKKWTGGCMCGEVRYETTGEPPYVGHCHCTNCRKHTGAPVVTLVGFLRSRVKFTKGNRKLYNSSTSIQRSFCGQCGTSLTWEGTYMNHPRIALHISTFDNPDAIIPSVHWNHKERISWFDVADKLPRMSSTGYGEPYHIGPVIEGPSL